MTDSFDSATSNLLCAENSNTCFDDLDSKVTDDLGHFPSNSHKYNQGPNFDHNRRSKSMIDFSSHSEERVSELVKRESEHLPRHDYLRRLRSGDLELGARGEAFDWIWKVGGVFTLLSSIGLLLLLVLAIAIQVSATGFCSSRTSYNMFLCNVTCLIVFEMSQVYLSGCGINDHGVCSESGCLWHLIGVAHSHYNFGPLCVWLSMNYLDRFLSLYELPRGRAWAVQLLAVACLSIAAKVEETNVPQSVDLQVGDPKYVFEAKTILRMELLVMSTLKWRMQACSAYSFIDYFLSKISDDQYPLASSVCRSEQLILSTIRGIDFLEFRPSEIAAAVAICISGEIQAQAVDIDKAISCFVHVDKERVLKCVELIKDLSLISGSANWGSASGPSVPQSPDGVLDAACLSYKSDELIVGSSEKSSHSSPDIKRRKPDNQS